MEKETVIPTKQHFLKYNFVFERHDKEFDYDQYKSIDGRHICMYDSKRGFLKIRKSTRTSVNTNVVSGIKISTVSEFNFLFSRLRVF